MSPRSTLLAPTRSKCRCRPDNGFVGIGDEYVEIGTGLWLEDCQFPSKAFRVCPEENCWASPAAPLRGSPKKARLSLYGKVVSFSAVNSRTWKHDLTDQLLCREIAGEPLSESESKAQGLLEALNNGLIAPYDLRDVSRAASYLHDDRHPNVRADIYWAARTVNLWMQNRRYLTDGRGITLSYTLMKRRGRCMSYIAWLAVNVSAAERILCSSLQRGQSPYRDALLHDLATVASLALHSNCAMHPGSARHRAILAATDVPRPQGYPPLSMTRFGGVVSYHEGYEGRGTLWCREHAKEAGR